VLDNPLVWLLAARLPRLFPGASLHRAALHATAAGASRTAEALFEGAAEHYRLDLEVEALARLRVHQLMARVRASADLRRDTVLCLEIEQRLTRLDRIESLEPPFALVPASRLLANWMVEARSVPPDARPPVDPAAMATDAA
jgi:hypothetical protein